jgi:hypothetical protein
LSLNICRKLSRAEKAAGTYCMIMSSLLSDVPHVLE